MSGWASPFRGAGEGGHIRRILSVKERVYSTLARFASLNYDDLDFSFVFSLIYTVSAFSPTLEDEAAESRVTTRIQNREK